MLLVRAQPLRPTRAWPSRIATGPMPRALTDWRAALHALPVARRLRAERHTLGRFPGRGAIQLIAERRFWPNIPRLARRCHSAVCSQAWSMASGVFGYHLTARLVSFHRDLAVHSIQAWSRCLKVLVWVPSSGANPPFQGAWDDKLDHSGIGVQNRWSSSKPAKAGLPASAARLAAIINVVTIPGVTIQRLPGFSRVNDIRNCSAAQVQCSSTRRCCISPGAAEFRIQQRGDGRRWRGSIHSGLPGNAADPGGSHPC